MTARWIRVLKSILPPPIYAPARNWAMRLITWRRLMGYVQGASARDGAWLWLSFMAAPITGLIGLSGWRDPLLLHDMVADVKGIGRFRLRAGTDDLWHVVPFRETPVLECIRRQLRPGDVFVDAGANIGTYTVSGAKLVGPSGTVLAIEMLAGTADVLRGHIELNGLRNVHVVEGALAARANERILASMPAGSFGQASITNATGGETFEVLSTTFDAILRDMPVVRLIKIDIEGAELEALKGASEALRRVESIIFEHLDQQVLEDIRVLLATHGFRTERLDGRNSLAFRQDAVFN